MSPPPPGALDVSFTYPNRTHIGESTTHWPYSDRPCLDLTVSHFPPWGYRTCHPGNVRSCVRRGHRLLSDPDAMEGPPRRPVTLTPSYRTILGPPHPRMVIGCVRRRTDYPRVPMPRTSRLRDKYGYRSWGVIGRTGVRWGGPAFFIRPTHVLQSPQSHPMIDIPGLTTGHHNVCSHWTPSTMGGNIIGRVPMDAQRRVVSGVLYNDQYTHC